ncbi:hypothetical protein BDW02DRAFT_603840 [Decorospora gaudefroyi]|uniref:Uncharacterized protein n=1 Tax=Decorospora gaudefroyi TaxID=184978 RepID=A0A6A5JXL2_9PLEO|nr:hypothetical protein BDW02DRAFT_603840 [Decorospora gaudefroyi]
MGHRIADNQTVGVTTSTITNAANLGKQAASRPEDWHYFVTSLLTVIRNAAHASKQKDCRIDELTLQLDSVQAPEGVVSRQDFSDKVKELKKLQSAMTRLHAS